MVPVTPQATRAATDAFYPLILNSGRIRDQWHTMTRTGSVPRLMQHIAEPIVEIAPADARRLQLREGELARIWSRNGVMVAKTVVSRGQRPARCLCRCTGIISLPDGEGSTTCCRR
jgi:assimilatory nitrate reductase catalytic subunit